MISPNRSLSPITNKDIEDYGKVLAYLRKLYPDIALHTFDQESHMLDFFALLGFCEMQQEKSAQLDQMVGQFKAYIQQQLQIEDLTDHCLTHSGCNRSKPAVEQMINDIVKVYFFTMQHIMRMFPAVQKPADTIIERVRAGLQSQTKRMRVGSAILIQIPIAEKVFTKQEEFEKFKTCKTLEEIEKKVQDFEMARIRNMSQEQIQNEPPHQKYALILKGENQPLSLPKEAPAVFQEAVDQSLEEGRPVCVEYKGPGPDGQEIEIGICALAILNKDAPQQAQPDIPDSMVLQAAQTQAAQPFIQSVILSAKQAVHLKKVS